MSAIKVRLLHAVVRSRILALANFDAKYFDSEANGLPINDLDSIGTVITFSASLVWIALPRQGIFLRDAEIQDFIALFRYIAYLMGTPTEHFATPTKARYMMESLLLSEIRPNDISRILVNNVIESLANQPPGESDVASMVSLALTSCRGL